jgi:serpin B
MYLVNALAFEAEWETIYNEYDVRDGEFTLINGVTQNVEYMYGEEHTYLEDENTTGFLKYYKDGKYAFAALLPKEGTNIVEYVKQLDGAKINKLLENKKSATVMTAIPKFETEYDISLKEVLESMGMKKAFNSSQADFTGLGTSTDGNIYISRVLHKTFISVCEKGTKAGAATIVEMDTEGAVIYEEYKEVNLDRPFVYLLVDCETNIPFFVGTAMQING